MSKKEAKSNEKERILKEFQQIPYVGPATARDLWRLGFRNIKGLSGREPDELYAALEKLEGKHVDRCVLYVFRCAFLLCFAHFRMQISLLLRAMPYQQQTNCQGAVQLGCVFRQEHRSEKNWDRRKRERKPQATSISQAYQT